MNHVVLSNEADFLLCILYREFLLQDLIQMATAGKGFFSR